MPNAKIAKGSLSLWNGRYPDKKGKPAKLSAFQQKVEDILTLKNPENNIEKLAYEAIVSQDYIDCSAQRLLFTAVFRRTPIFRALVRSEEFMPRYVTVGDTRIDLGEAFDVLSTYNNLVSTFKGKAYVYLVRTYDQCFPEEIMPQDEDGSHNLQKEDGHDPDVDVAWNPDPNSRARMRPDDKNNILLSDRDYTQEYAIVAIFEDGLVMKLTSESCMLHMDQDGDIAGKAIKCIQHVNKDHVRSVEYIVHTRTGYSVIRLPIRKQNVDVAKQYNDDLPDDNVINALLDRQSGIVLLHGDPGTGKTSYIRHLAYSMPRKFIFLDKSMFGCMTDSEFVNMLSKKKGSIVVLEDCEDLLIDRSQYNESMSTILNLSDGILGDGFAIKFICTFNCPLDKIDSAITRKGRLKVKYEFKPLCQEKAQALLKELGSDKTAEGPMTLADIYGHDVETGFVKEPEKKSMGFGS